MAASGDGDALAPGTMVGAYRIEYRLGGGGMGTVYAAEEPRIRKRVAVKVLRHALADDASFAARFEREARAANDVKHPAIVDVFAFGKLDDGRPYLVMSMLEGRSLADEIRERGKIPPSEAWPLAREIADALAAAHRAGVIHRDLKPENIFVERFAGRAPRPRLLDLGLAKFTAIGGADDDPGGDRLKLTATGAPMGTPRYMAPEQWWGTDVDPRVDQYALGVTLFEMLAGHPPFRAQQFMELADQHTHAAPPRLAAEGVVVPAAVEALVARALAKKATDRFASMDDLVAAGDAAFGNASGALDATRLAAPAAPETATPGPSPIGAPAEIARAPLTAAGSGHALRRYFRLHVLLVLGGPAALIAIGYAGSDRRNVREWWLMAGMFIWGVGGAYVLGCFACLGAARLRVRDDQRPFLPWFIALATAAIGSLGTYLGWRKTSEGVAHVHAPTRFEIMHQGIYELEVNRFLGSYLAAVLFVSIAAAAGLGASPDPSATLAQSIGLRRRESIAAALGLVVLAAFALAVGAPSGCMLAAFAASVVAADLVFEPRDRRTAAAAEIERAVAGGAALALAFSAALSRVDARAAVLWGDQPTRAARIAEMLLAGQERERTLMIGAIACLALAAVEAIRLHRVFSSRAPGRSLGRPIAMLVVVATLGVVDYAMHAGFASTRAELHAELAPQFSLFARLDPPTADLDRKRFAPQPAPAVQIATNVVAVNARPSAPLLALDSEQGAATVSRDLSHALADQAAHAEDDSDSDVKARGSSLAPVPVDLAVSVDRKVAWHAVDRLLGIAYRAGVRHAEVLLTSGPAPILGADAPPEASWVLAKDFVAIDVELVAAARADEPGVFHARDDEPFGDVAPALARLAASGAPIRIAPR